jgi:hypothetical protein
MKRIFLALIFLATCLGTGGTALATPSLSWTSAELGGGYWRYDYTIANDLPDQAVNSFNIDFAYGLYYPDDMEITAFASGWENSVLVPPGDSPATGWYNGTFYGISNPCSEIAPESSLAGFSISFLWLLDSDTPLGSLDGLRADGDQAFTYTTSPVPEPGTIILLGLGLAGCAACRMIKRKQSAS